MKLTIRLLTLLLCTVFVFTACHQEPKVDKPKGTISYETAKKLQQNFLETRAKPLSRLLNQNGTITGEVVRDVTFDLATVKQYIAYVEQEARNKGIAPETLGLRVYLGAYPKGDNNYPSPGRGTVFFMPTHQKKANPNANHFFPFYQDEVMDDVEGLNYGQSGNPPNDLD